MAVGVGAALTTFKSCEPEQSAAVGLEPTRYADTHAA